jgi:alkylated DNA nucleotide flippase Atl1
MASSRADEVAELLWELKRAGKLATYTHIARRAGFSAGANGRAMDSCLRVVRRDWPHLQWYRAIRDDGVMEKDGEQMKKLVEAGYEVQLHENGKGHCVCSLETHLVDWTVAPAAAPEGEPAPA